MLGINKALVCWKQNPNINSIFLSVTFTGVETLFSSGFINIVSFFG